MGKFFEGKGSGFMYKRNAVILLCVNAILILCWGNVKFLELNYRVSAYADTGMIRDVSGAAIEEGTSTRMSIRKMASGQRIIDYGVLENKARIVLSAEDYNILLRIVQAEAGSEDETGRLLVANVVLNRVKSERFPGTVTEVVYQSSGGKQQFCPVANGQIDHVKITRETINAVEKALNGEDISKGALFFVARKYADPEKMKWFDNHLKLLFSYGGHEFFS